MMNKFENYSSDGKCDVCGKESKIVVCVSSMGACSFAYCQDCLSKGLEPYYAITANHSCLDDEDIAWFADKNENLLKQFYHKTKEEFINDCK